GRRQRHPLPLEREAGTTLRVGRIIAAQLIDQLAHFLYFTIELLAHLPDIGTRSARSALALPGLVAVVSRLALGRGGRLRIRLTGRSASWRTARPVRPLIQLIQLPRQ